MLLHPLLARDNAAQVLQFLPIDDVCSSGKTNRGMRQLVATSSVAWSQPVTLHLSRGDKLLDELSLLVTQHPCTNLVVVARDNSDSEPTEDDVEIVTALVNVFLAQRFTRVRHLRLVGVNSWVCVLFYAYLRTLAPHLETLQLNNTVWTSPSQHRLEMILGSMPRLAKVVLQRTNICTLAALLKRSEPASLKHLVVQGSKEYDVCLATGQGAYALHAKQKEIESEDSLSIQLTRITQESYRCLAAIVEQSLRPDTELEHVHWIGSGGFGLWMAPLADLGPSVTRLQLEGFVFLTANLLLVSRRLKHVRRLELTNCVQRMFSLTQPASAPATTGGVRDLTLDHHMGFDTEECAQRLQCILGFFPGITTLRLTQDARTITGRAASPTQPSCAALADALCAAALPTLAHLDVSRQARCQLAATNKANAPLLDLVWTLRLPPSITQLTLGVASGTTISDHLVTQVARFQSMFSRGRTIHIVQA